MADALMTIDQLADFLSVARKTIYQWRYRGEGPPGFRLAGGQVRYRQDDVIEWLASQADRRPAA